MKTSPSVCVGLILAALTVSASVAGEDGPRPSEADPQETGATLDQSRPPSDFLRQQLVADVRQRVIEARTLVEQRQPERALDRLRLAQEFVRLADGVDEATIASLEHELDSRMLATIGEEDQIVARRVEELRLALTGAAPDEPQAPEGPMVGLDRVLAPTRYGRQPGEFAGDLGAAVLPFGLPRWEVRDGRIRWADIPPPFDLALPELPAGFVAENPAFGQVEALRLRMFLEDLARAAVPFPDTELIRFPPGRQGGERRIERPRRGPGVLLDRDPKTKMILAKLEEPIPMRFPQGTPLEEALAYIKSATAAGDDPGIPIYVDPVGLLEAENSLRSEVMLDLDGVPLKASLWLLLKQLGLTYTVKDGLLTITSR